jgi:hypothetical protein
MHEILILPVDFKASNSVPTSDGREGLKLLVNKVREDTVGEKKIQKYHKTEKIT